MDPSSERSGGWNFVFCKEVLLVYLWEDTLYCWVILLFMRWRWLWCWEDDARSDSWVVILSSTINKVLWVFLHIIVYLWILLFMNAIVWSMCFWFHIVYDVLYGDALMVCFYFDSTSTLWSRTSRRGVTNSIKERRNQARIKAEDPSWSSFLLFHLSHLKELLKSFHYFFLR